MTNFKVKAIQAEHGEALLISYNENPMRYILVDGGPAQAYPNLIRELERCRQGASLRLEALVVTHYDLDHIGGIIKLLTQQPPWLDIGDIWFNGFRHTRHADILGVGEADELTEIINRRGLPWNKALDHKAVKFDPRKPIKLPGEMEIWILSPTQRQLTNLNVHWARELKSGRASYVSPLDLLGHTDRWPPSPFLSYSRRTAARADTSISNGSSIGLLLQHEGKRVLLSGDSYASVLTESIRMLFGSKLRLDLFKVSHHGSLSNTSKVLLDSVDCERYLICTNGKYHNHPDHALIALLLNSSKSKEILFNYETDKISKWREPPSDWPKFAATYPRSNEPYIEVII